MPYSVKNNCVYKKDGGAKVGCTNGSVKKYLAALHANANERVSSRLKDELNLINLEETLLEDYPSHFDMEHFKSLTSFKDRIAYCQENLKKIAAGTSRIVYKIDDTKVLKLAKNNKGIAQNKIEYDLNGRNDWYAGILADVLDTDGNGLWVEMELAIPAKNSDFEKYLGYDLDVILDYLEYMYWMYIKHDKERAEFTKPDDSTMEDIVEHQDGFVGELVNMMAEHKINPADFGKKSSYGVVNREGHPTLVLIDFGLTDEVYGTYYG